MDFNRKWTEFALQAEIDDFGLSRIVSAHNAIMEELSTYKSGHVYVVQFGNYGPPEVDSLWYREEDAYNRKEQLGGMWEVATIAIHLPGSTVND